jgi:hypothetical protein
MRGSAGPEERMMTEKDERAADIRAYIAVLEEDSNRMLPYASQRWAQEDMQMNDIFITRLREELADLEVGEAG